MSIYTHMYRKIIAMEASNLVWGFFLHKNSVLTVIYAFYRKRKIWEVLFLLLEGQVANLY